MEDISARRTRNSARQRESTLTPFLANKDQDKAERGMIKKADARDARVMLADHALWSTFHRLQNEMIITKGGRCLFPFIKLVAQNLTKSSTYSIGLDIVRTSRDRYRFKNDEWKVLKSEGEWGSEGPCGDVYWAAGGPMTDLEPGHFRVTSFFLYQPRIHLVEHVENGEDIVTCFEFEETSFIAVTHYQNHKVNCLKKNHNPHAKGFKDDHVKTTSRELALSKPSVHLSSPTRVYPLPSAYIHTSPLTPRRPPNPKPTRPIRRVRKRVRYASSTSSDTSPSSSSDSDSDAPTFMSTPRTRFPTPMAPAKAFLTVATQTVESSFGDEPVTPHPTPPRLPPCSALIAVADDENPLRFLAGFCTSVLEGKRGHEDVEDDNDEED